MNQRAEIAKEIGMLAEYYDKTLTVGQLSMYVEDLIDLRPEELSGAIREYRNKIENDRFPLPSKLKSLARPQPTEEQNAVDAVSRIVEAISRFGPYRHLEAKGYIGEMGWLVVCREGGWSNVCQNLTEDNMGTMRAQWREMAKALSAKSKAGTIEIPPELPKLQIRNISKIGTLLGSAFTNRLLNHD